MLTFWAALRQAQSVSSETMKYRPTPFNIICGIATIFIIYAAIYPDPEGWGFALAIRFLLPIILSGVIFDFIFQKFGPSYFWTLKIESFIICIILLWSIFPKRTKTFIIPDTLESRYIVTIYGVDKKPKLPNGWNYEIKIPTNGILMTSSTFNDDLPETKMKTYSGLKLSSEESNLGWIEMYSDKIKCGEKYFDFQFWIVDSFCCIHSSNEIDTFKINLQNQFCLTQK